MNAVLAFITTYPLFSGGAIVTVIGLVSTWCSAGWFEGRLSKHTPPTDQPTIEQQTRFWEHALHEDRNINDRANFFLVFQSVLLGVVGTIYSRSTGDPNLLTLFAILGLTISLIWALIQARHKFMVDSMVPRLKSYFPEYKLTLEWRQKWPLPGGLLMTYAVPALVTLVWLVLLAVFQHVSITGFW